MKGSNWKTHYLNLQISVGFGKVLIESMNVVFVYHVKFNGRNLNL